MELHELFLFGGIEPSECTRMMDCLAAQEISFCSGDVILDFSQNKNAVGIVRHGEAMMFRVDTNGNRTLLEPLPENSIFGETLAFSGTMGDSLFVACEKDCSIIFIDYGHITKRCANVCACHTMLLQNMFRLISTKTLSLSERIEVITNRSIRDKLLCYFQILSARMQSNTFQLPFSISALAEYICADRSAMSRELSKMKQDGLIEMRHRTVTLIVNRPV